MIYTVTKTVKINLEEYINGVYVAELHWISPLGMLTIIYIWSNRSKKSRKIAMKSHITIELAAKLGH
jgi:hypothetical protein